MYLLLKDRITENTLDLGTVNVQKANIRSNIPQIKSTFKIYYHVKPSFYQLHLHLAEKE